MVAMETGMSNKPNDEEKSFIYIEFEDIGSVNVSISNFESVTAFQLLAMAHLLEFEGKNHLAVERAAQMQAQMQKQPPQIITPKIMPLNEK
jgi:hypothetical protein